MSKEKSYDELSLPEFCAGYAAIQKCGDRKSDAFKAYFKSKYIIYTIRTIRTVIVLHYALYKISKLVSDS